MPGEIRPLPARFPEGTRLAPANPSEETLRLLANRRSAKWAELRSPGPSPDELDTLIAIASRVPDHGKIAPWRYLLVLGEDRLALGRRFADILAAREPGAPQERLALESQRFAQVPAVIVLISAARELHKIPVWEQELSAGASAMTLLIAANAMGYAGSWITEWYAYDSDARTVLGLKSGERVAGFIGLGTVEAVLERARTEPKSLTTRWRG